MAIAISPRTKTVTKGTMINFTISGSGYRPEDYRVIFRAEGVKKFEKGFLGPSTFSYTASHTFNNIGSIALEATLTAFPSMITETATGTITVEAEPEPGWEFHSIYRGIAIYVWMPAGTPYGCYLNSDWYAADSLSALKAAIDDFLGPEPGVYVIGYMWDFENEVYVRPKFLFGGKVVEGAPGEIFARVDTAPGSYSIEMITEGYNFDWWDTWGEPGAPTFTDQGANPTTIHVTENCYFFCWVYPTPPIPTAITLTLQPAAVDPGATYRYTGRLTRTDTGAGLPDMTVIAKIYDKAVDQWVEVGRGTTGSTGAYDVSATAPIVKGTFNCRIEFPGTDAFATAYKATNLGVGLIPVILQIAGPTAAGIALILLSAR